jgi:hypothetical protein
MKKMISYPSTPQFREVVANINRRYNFTGLDENGDAIYDPSIKKPIMKFIGTVKLHGTSASVIYNDISGLWVQSRSNIITPTPSKLIEVEFEDGTKQLFDSDKIINGKLITDYTIGDIIVL